MGFDSPARGKSRGRGQVRGRVGNVTPRGGSRGGRGAVQKGSGGVSTPRGRGRGASRGGRGAMSEGRSGRGGIGRGAAKNSGQKRRREESDEEEEDDEENIVPMSKSKSAPTTPAGKKQKKNQIELEFDVDDDEDVSDMEENEDESDEEIVVIKGMKKQDGDSDEDEDEEEEDESMEEEDDEDEEDEDEEEEEEEEEEVKSPPSKKTLKPVKKETPAVESTLEKKEATDTKESIDIPVDLVSLQEQRREEENRKKLYVTGFDKNSTSDEVKSLHPFVIDAISRPGWGKCWLIFENETNAEKAFKDFKIRGLQANYCGSKNTSTMEKKAEEEHPINRKVLCVRGLKPDVKVESVRKVFKSASEIIVHSWTRKDRQNNVSPWALIVYKDEKEAFNAFHKGKDLKVDGRPVSVMYAYVKPGKEEKLARKNVKKERKPMVVPEKKKKEKKNKKDKKKKQPVAIVSEEGNDENKQDESDDE